MVAIVSKLLLKHPKGRLVMRCPNCLKQDTKVIDSRNLQDGDHVRRRRKCEACEHRFTTYEKTEAILPAVLKRDGRSEPLNCKKISGGLRKACQKRPINLSEIESFLKPGVESFTIDNDELIDHTSLRFQFIEELKNAIIS